MSHTNQLNDLEAIRRALFTGQKSAAKTAAQEAFVRVAEFVNNVTLLDAWAHGPSGVSHRIHDTGRGTTCCTLGRDDCSNREFYGYDAPEARTAAVKAITGGEVP